MNYTHGWMHDPLLYCDANNSAIGYTDSFHTNTFSAGAQSDGHCGFTYRTCTNRDADRLGVVAANMVAAHNDTNRPDAADASATRSATITDVRRFTNDATHAIQWVASRTNISRGLMVRALSNVSAIPVHCTITAGII